MNDRINECRMLEKHDANGFGASACRLFAYMFFLHAAYQIMKAGGIEDLKIKEKEKVTRINAA